MTAADARKVVQAARLELGTGDATREHRAACERSLTAAREGFAEMAKESPAEWTGVQSDMVVWGIREGVRDALGKAVAAIVAQSAKNAKAAKKSAPVLTPPDAPGIERLTDLGNARRFVRLEGKNFRFCSTTAAGGWLRWTGQRWEPDDTGAHARAAKRIPDCIRADADRAARLARDSASGDPDVAAEKAYGECMAWADSTESAGGLDAIIRVARTEQELIVRRPELDADPWTFNTPTGTLSLRSGEVHPNRRSDLLTQIGGVGYDPTATCLRWARFVLEIMDGDAEMVAYLQRIVGYAMVGEVREAAFFIFWGNGRNGKGTFVERIRKVLGTYACNTPTGTFVNRRDGIPNDLAALDGRRLVTMSESSDGAPLEEALVKQVTGGDPMTARFMRGEFFDFIPVFTPILSTNNKPVVKGMDPAIWARLHMVPFTVSFVGREDHDLKHVLDAELPGILNWCLDGLADWRDNGLKVPAKAKAAGLVYRAEMDVVGRFLEDCTRPSTVENADNTELYRAFVRWSQDNGEREKSQRWLTQAMQNRQLEQVCASRKYWRGIELLASK